MVNEREIILKSLIEILDNGAYSHIVISDVLNKYDYLDESKKAFIKRVTDGTIERLYAIDVVINKFAKKPADKQKPVIREILRMSVYQLLYMDRVPEHAIINEAVKLTKKSGYSALSGFVNGVLRNIARNKEELIENDIPLMPEWIEEYITESYGEEKAALIMADASKEHLITVRFRGEDKQKPLREGLIKSKLADSYYVPKGKSVKALDGFSSGEYIVQDISSQLAVLSAGIKQGDTVLDVCAAPGGKAVYAYDLGADVTARDVSKKRVDILNESIKRLAQINKAGGSIKAEVFDALTPDKEFIGKADIVLADMPCSGLGVMGKKSDIKYKTKKEDIDALSRLQRSIIDIIWQYVKPGGVLLYSTCTLGKAENDEQIDYILSNYPFKLSGNAPYLKDGKRQLLQGVDDTDGFFMARLMRI